MAQTCHPLGEIYLSFSSPSYTDTFFVEPIDESTLDVFRVLTPTFVLIVACLVVSGQVFNKQDTRLSKRIDRATIDATSAMLWMAVGFGIVFGYPRDRFPSTGKHCAVQWLVPILFLLAGLAASELILRFPKLAHVYVSLLVAGASAFLTVSTFPRIDNNTSNHFLGWGYKAWTLMQVSAVGGGAALWWINRRKWQLAFLSSFVAGWSFVLAIQQTATDPISDSAYLDTPIAATVYALVILTALLGIVLPTKFLPNARHRVPLPLQLQWDLVGDGGGGACGGGDGDGKRHDAAPPDATTTTKRIASGLAKTRVEGTSMNPSKRESIYSNGGLTSEGRFQPAIAFEQPLPETMPPAPPRPTRSPYAAPAPLRNWHPPPQPTPPEPQPSHPHPHRQSSPRSQSPRSQSPRSPPSPRSQSPRSPRSIPLPTSRASAARAPPPTVYRF